MTRVKEIIKKILQSLLGFAVFFVCVFVGGVNLKFIFSIIGVGAFAVPFVWKFAMNDARRGRLLSFIDPDKYLDYSYQLRRTMMAIGSGRLTGEGIGEGTMNMSKKIPVKMSDSIFAVIGEEAGFIGCVIVVVLMTVMLTRMIYISYKARETFGKCVAAGIFAMFAFNIIENITGERSLYLRAPYGDVSAYQLKKLDVVFVSWTFSTYDWQGKDADYIYERIMKKASDGDIILLHDTKKATVEAVLKAIPELQRQGYEFVRVDELLARNGEKIKMGTPYRWCKHERSAFSF